MRVDPRSRLIFSPGKLCFNLQIHNPENLALRLTAIIKRYSTKSAIDFVNIKITVLHWLACRLARVLSRGYIDLYHPIKCSLFLHITIAVATPAMSRIDRRTLAKGRCPLRRSQINNSPERYNDPS